MSSELKDVASVKPVCHGRPATMPDLSGTVRDRHTVEVDAVVEGCVDVELKMEAAQGSAGTWSSSTTLHVCGKLMMRRKIT